MIDWRKQKGHKEGPVPPDLPDSILSLHVDHDLQNDAAKMARAADAAATKFKAADHSELRIPWGSPPFPSRPGAGEGGDGGGGGGGGGDATESVARTARYRLMFDAMVRRRVHVLATGHHADDQVETVLMRLGSGSTALGLGGMRPVRRFGMALGKREGDFGWFGHEGLDRWIVRPLLDVTKVSAPAPPLLTLVGMIEFARDCMRRCALGQNPRDLRFAWHSLRARPYEFSARAHAAQCHSPCPRLQRKEAPTPG